MHPIKAGDKVTCLDAPTSPYATVKKGVTYFVLETKLRSQDHEPMVRLRGCGESFFMAKRFELVSDPIAPTAPQTLRSVPSVGSDEREERYRAMLTTTTDPFTCKKCGAPKATCTYH